MNEPPIVVLYKTRNRSLSPLQEACNSFGMSFLVVESEEEFRKGIHKGVISCIIVPLGSIEQGGEHVREFANMAAKILQPEDADINIIYSAEELTPQNWPGSLDPRPVQSYDDPQFLPDDKQWVHTIEKLRSSMTRFSYHRNQDIVETEFESNANVPFPSEARYLLRAAFKDMSKILIKFPKQGLSGSIACVVHPYDAQGNKCVQMFVKIYPGHEKTQRELERYLNSVYRYIDSNSCPMYQNYRRYRGKAYSLMVMDLVEGPNRQLLTFREMVQSPDFSVEQIKNITSAVLSIIERWPRTKPTNVLNLLDEYLGPILPKDDNRLKLESENTCHGWFGDFATGLSIGEKIRASLPTVSLEGTTSQICHGDLHGDNIMVKDIGGRLSPVPIDFSRTGKTHSLKDLVTLVSDMIIHGLTGVMDLHNAEKIQTFLESLEGGNDSYIKQNASAEKASLQIEKVRVVIKELRKNAFSVHGVTEIEYAGAALLKTLEVLSYGKLPPDQNERATAYVTYLSRKIREPQKK